MQTLYQNRISHLGKTAPASASVQIKNVSNQGTSAIMKNKIVLTFASLLLVVTGCATGSYHSRQVNPASTPVTVDPQGSEIFYGETKAHLLSILERHGFTVTTNQPGALFLKTGVRHGFTTVTARVGLVNERKEIIVSGRAENYGWGVWMAPGAAQDHIVRSAILAFDRELAKACKPQRVARK